jgi:predicted phage terminase large subunit-like protein
LKPVAHLQPQAGAQTLFMANQADICIFASGAGCGKSYALLLEGMRYRNTPGYNAVIFRKTSPMLLAPGALWDQSCEIYPRVGGKGSKHHLTWRWPSSAVLKMSHLEDEANMYDWQGSQLGFVGFDELAGHFSEASFFYMLSRLRSMTGLRPYCRATTNAAPGWVANLIEHWIDPDTGYPNWERSGKIRFLARDGDEIHWGETADELKAKLGPDCEPKSFSVVFASLEDNPIMTEKNKGYVSNLKALPLIERERLLYSNWHISAAAGLFFKSHWFERVSAAPMEGTVCRAWDRAGSTSEKADYTAGVKLRRDKRGVYYVENVVRLRGSPLDVEKSIINTALLDGVETAIVLEQDPGQAGKADVGNLIRALAGYNVRAVPITHNKEVRAKPVSAQCEAGNIKLVEARWNEAFLMELANFPEKGTHDDQVDAFSCAFNYLAKPPFKVFLA